MEYYQKLFNHMADYHGITLVQTEMDDIIAIVNKMKTTDSNLSNES